MILTPRLLICVVQLEFIRAALSIAHCGVRIFSSFLSNSSDPESALIFPFRINTSYESQLFSLGYLRLISRSSSASVNVKDRLTSLCTGLFKIPTGIPASSAKVEYRNAGCDSSTAITEMFSVPKVCAQAVITSPCRLRFQNYGVNFASPGFSKIDSSHWA